MGIIGKYFLLIKFLAEIQVSFGFVKFYYLVLFNTTIIKINKP